MLRTALLTPVKRHAWKQAASAVTPEYSKPALGLGLKHDFAATPTTIAGVSASWQARSPLSSNTTAAQAAKQAGSKQDFGTFASSTPAAASTATVTAAGATQGSRQDSVLRRLAKAAAVLLGAVGLMTTGVASADSPQPWQWLFQAMFDLHHDIMFFLITIVTLVLYMMFQVATKFHYTKQIKPEKFTHHTTLEIIWTIIPTFIVLSIALPSLTLIYSLDQHTDRPGLTVKVIGRQWYWNYEMHDHLQHKLVDPDRLAAIAERSILNSSSSPK